MWHGRPFDLAMMMPVKLQVLALAAAMIGPFGCQRLTIRSTSESGTDSRSGTGSIARTVSVSATAASRLPRTETETLALAEVSETQPVDETIKTLQNTIFNTSKIKSVGAAEWVALGQAWTRKARYAADPGFYLNAEGCTQLALLVEPEHVGAKNLFGLVLLNQHRFADARDTADTVLRQFPDDLLALAISSDARLELGDFGGAADSAQRMIDLKPNLASYSRVAHLRWLSGDGRGAKQLMRDAIAASDPRDPEPRAWIAVQAANVFWHEGDYVGANAGYDLALEWLSRYPPALVGKAQAAMAMDNPRAAIPYLKEAYEKSPLAETLWLLGNAQESAGDVLGSQRTFARLELEGSRDPRTLALFYATKNIHTDKATTLAEREFAERPGLYTRDTYAWALYRANRVVEASAVIGASKPRLERRTGWPDQAGRSAGNAPARREAEALSSIGRGPSNAADAFSPPGRRPRVNLFGAIGELDARLLYHRGAIAIANGQTSKGRKLVERALSLNSHFDADGVREARALLGRPDAVAVLHSVGGAHATTQP